MPKLGFTNDEPVKITAEILYARQPINYRPGFWEEIKWAWMQYLSILVIFIYFVKKGLTNMFSSRHLKSYISIPWQHEKTL